MLEECLPKIKNVHPRPIAERPKNRWFDGDCRTLRRKLHNRHGKEGPHRRTSCQPFLETRMRYKQLIRNKKCNFQSQAIKTLESLRRRDSGKQSSLARESDQVQTSRKKSGQNICKE